MPPRPAVGDEEVVVNVLVTIVGVTGSGVATGDVDSGVDRVLLGGEDWGRLGGAVWLGLSVPVVSIR